MTMSAAALAELEGAEYMATDALSRMASSDPRRAQLQELLAQASITKASLLARPPSTLRKGAAHKRSIGLPTPTAEVVKTVIEERDRIAEGRRLGKGSGDEFERFSRARAGLRPIAEADFPLWLSERAFQ